MLITPAQDDPQSLAAAEATYSTRLLAYINDRLLPPDWHRSDQLAEETWQRARHYPDLPLAETDSGLPAWLAAAARTVLRRHFSPTAAMPDDIDWAVLTQQLGHSTTWPELWHDVLATEGQAALLRLVAGAPAAPLAATGHHSPAALAA